MVHILDFSWLFNFISYVARFQNCQEMLRRFGFDKGSPSEMNDVKGLQVRWSSRRLKKFHEQRSMKFDVDLVFDGERLIQETPLKLYKACIQLCFPYFDQK